MIHTTPEAVLAAALFAHKRPSSWPTWDEYRSAMGQQAVQDPWLEDAAAILAALDGWTLVRRDDLRRWNVSHGNTCYATTLGPDARCTCGLSAALAVVLVIVEKP